METVNIHDAKTHLSQLLKRIEDGEEIVIARAGVPIAKLVAYKEDLAPREFGQWKGQVWMSDDFDDPLPEEIMKYFRGEGE